MFTLVKRYRRLFIVDDVGVTAYCPPDFIKITDRRGLQRLADDLNAGVPRYRAVRAFEAAHHPVKALRIPHAVPAE